MIREWHKHAIRKMENGEYEELENVVYESIVDVPFDGFGFETKAKRTNYIKNKKKKLHDFSKDRDTVPSDLQLERTRAN